MTNFNHCVGSVHNCILATYGFHAGMNMVVYSGMR